MVNEEIASSAVMSLLTWMTTLTAPTTAVWQSKHTTMIQSLALNSPIPMNAWLLLRPESLAPQKHPQCSGLHRQAATASRRPERPTAGSESYR